MSSLSAERLPMNRSMRSISSPVRGDLGNPQLHLTRLRHGHVEAIAKRLAGRVERLLARRRGRAARDATRPAPSGCLAEGAACGAARWRGVLGCLDYVVVAVALDGALEEQALGIGRAAAFLGQRGDVICGCCVLLRRKTHRRQNAPNAKVSFIVVLLAWGLSVCQPFCWVYLSAVRTAWNLLDGLSGFRYSRVENVLLLICC